MFPYYDLRRLDCVFYCPTLKIFSLKTHFRLKYPLLQCYTVLVTQIENKTEKKLKWINCSLISNYKHLCILDQTYLTSLSVISNHLHQYFTSRLSGVLQQEQGCCFYCCFCWCWRWYWSEVGCNCASWCWVWSIVINTINNR